MFDNKINTMDFHLAMNEGITGNSHNMRSQRINANNFNFNNNNNNNNNTDHKRKSSDSSSSVEDTNNMFTKFAFPFKLHSILERAGASGQESIISWLPSGKTFKIHKPKEFADVIMPQYFNQTKYRSFQRQLYIYGFDRVKDKSSDDCGAYYHELFIRGASDLCLDMQRKKIKGTGLSNEERRKKASDLRANLKPSSNKRPLKVERDTPQQCLTTKNQASMLSNSHTKSSQSIYASLGLNSLSAQLQQQAPVKVESSEEWNSANAAALIKSALQVQEIASRQNNLNTIQNNSNNNGMAGRLLQYDKMIKAGRRCSLGFVRGMGRRGSLLFDGDEVCFGDRKFYFTNEYWL